MKIWRKPGAGNCFLDFNHPEQDCGKRKFDDILTKQHPQAQSLDNYHTIGSIKAKLL
jgi:hypothetical protein